MTNRQKKENELAKDIDAERNRVEMRDKRRGQFQEGLVRCDSIFDGGKARPAERIRTLMDAQVAAFDAGNVPLDIFGWHIVEYVGSFDMRYDYLGTTWAGDDEATGEPFFKADIRMDSLDEVAITAQVRKSLHDYLVAGAALAKRIGSAAYEGWIAMLLDVTQNHRSSFHVFSEEYPFQTFYDTWRETIKRTWADNEVSLHTRTARRGKKG